MKQRSLGPPRHRRLKVTGRSVASNPRVWVLAEQAGLLETLRLLKLVPESIQPEHAAQGVLSRAQESRAQYLG